MKNILISHGKTNLLVLNLIVLATYWGVSHVNWLVFKNVGVLPMPIWPAAGMAHEINNLWLG